MPIKAQQSLTARREGILVEKVFVWVARFAVFAPLIVLGWLLFKLIGDAIPRLDWDFITSLDHYKPEKSGIYPALMGSLWLMTLTALIALPLGVAAAVYLEEYGRTSRLAGLIEVFIANLAGVPSIIYGMLGLAVFVRFAALGPYLLAGALTLALLVLPVIIMSTREALRTVRDSLREGALALGATRWRTIWHVVLPMSIPGILTGAILAMSRAIGETAPLFMVGAVVSIGFAPDGVDSPYTALPRQIFTWASMPGDRFVPNAAAAIVVLMVVLLLLNSVAIWLRNRYQKRAV